MMDYFRKLRLQKLKLSNFKQKNGSESKFFAKDWNYGQTYIHDISFGVLKFSKLYDRNMILIRYFLATLAGLISGIFSFFFIQGTGIYNLGFKAVFQGIARLVYFTSSNRYHSDAIYYLNFWVLNLLFNLPLTWFAYLKIGKHFALLSIVSMTSSTVTGLILSFIPNLEGFYIFGSPLTTDTKILSQKIQILQWYSNPANTTANGLNDSVRIVILFTYGLMIGLITTLPNIITYIIGGSTGGADYIVFYYSKKKLKSFATFSAYLTSIITILSFILGTYIPYVMLLKKEISNTTTSFLVANLFSPIIIATLLSAWLRRTITNFFYPQFKIMSVKIYTSDTRLIRDLFLKNKFAHAFTINNSIGGYSLEQKSNIEVVCFFREIQEIIKILLSIKTEYLIFATPVNTLIGKFRCRCDFD